MIMNRSAHPTARRSQLAQKLLVFCFSLSVIACVVLAQQAAGKRPLNHSDYDAWRVIQQQQLTSDGKFLAYVLNPQDADGEVVVRNLASSTEWRHPRGHRPDTPAASTPDDQGRGGGARGGGSGAGASGLAFTSDGRFCIFQVFPTKAENEAARKENRRPAEMPQNAMGIMDLSTGKVERIERVRRFTMPEENGNFVAYLLEPKPEPGNAQARGQDAAGAANPQSAGGARQSGAAGSGGRQGGARGAAGNRGGAARTEYGVDLVVRNLTDNNERTIPDVVDFSFSKDARNLTYTVS
jgi:hypothetical protein